MLKVGLTGGYATGKSFVADELGKLGCHIINADRLGHAVLQPQGAAYAPTLELFGNSVLALDGTIDRKKLGAIVFADAALLQKLNAVVHPAVFHLEEETLARFAILDPHGIAVLEAAILIETGRYASCAKLIVTFCDREIQIARGIKRDGIAREAVLARLNSQLPLDEKKTYADFLIDTGGEKPETVKQVQNVYRALRAIP